MYEKSILKTQWGNIRQNLRKLTGKTMLKLSNKQLLTQFRICRLQNKFFFCNPKLCWEFRQSLSQSYNNSFNLPVTSSESRWSSYTITWKNTFFARSHCFIIKTYGRESFLSVIWVFFFLIFKQFLKMVLINVAKLKSKDWA